MGKEKKERKWVSRLKNRYRLVVMNEDTLEERASFRLRPLNVFVFFGLGAILLIILTSFIIAFTPLREYIPGYSDFQTRRRVVTLLQRTDSMERALAARDLFIRNMRNVINGDIAPEQIHTGSPEGQKYDTIHKLYKSPADSLLREEIESRDPYSLAEPGAKSMSNSISGFFFFPPVKGTITSRFDPVKKHYGIDIVSNANEAIKSTLDGTVVLANFTSETGWVIGIQHQNNLFSLYKHNSALLKKTGEFVKAGDVIAVIGNSGELSEGPHLHFELWFNGTALDPQKYIAF